jgi:hypothetical protein
MSLDEAYFNRILSSMKDDVASQWALEAITDIESIWDFLCESIPSLRQTEGVKHAQKLAGWLRNGSLSPNSTVANLPNSILGPLVVIAQLVEYLHHVKSQSPDAAGTRTECLYGFHSPSLLHTETVGCCLGVFSALAVSSSSSWAQFCQNAAAVLRAVFVLGALSDAQDTRHHTGPSISLIAFWKGGRSVADLKRVLEKHADVSRGRPSKTTQLTNVTDLHFGRIRRQQGDGDSTHTYHVRVKERPTSGRCFGNRGRVPRSLPCRSAL